MLENYLVKGLVIGIVFGVPAGVVTGMGSSVADVFYALVGVYGITVMVGLFRNRITDGFYLKLNRILGTLMILFGIVIGVRGWLL